MKMNMTPIIAFYVPAKPVSCGWYSYSSYMKCTHTWFVSWFWENETQEKLAKITLELYQIIASFWILGRLQIRKPQRSPEHLLDLSPMSCTQIVLPELMSFYKWFLCCILFCWMPISFVLFLAKLQILQIFLLCFILLLIYTLHPIKIGCILCVLMFWSLYQMQYQLGIIWEVKIQNQVALLICLQWVCQWQRAQRASGWQLKWETRESDSPTVPNSTFFFFFYLEGGLLRERETQKDLPSLAHSSKWPQWL